MSLNKIWEFTSTILKVKVLHPTSKAENPTEAHPTLNVQLNQNTRETEVSIYLSIW